jgi:hypothetical protein
MRSTAGNGVSRNEMRSSHSEADPQTESRSPRQYALRPAEFCDVGRMASPNSNHDRATPPLPAGGRSADFRARHGAIRNRSTAGPVAGSEPDLHDLACETEMNPDQRIRDCYRLERELKASPNEMPWYSTPLRQRQQNENWAASQFTWIVHEWHRVGDAPEVWHEIVAQLHKWYSQGAAH